VSIARCVFRLLLVLWAGSLWSLAAWVAPTVFHLQADRHLAGILAERLFSIETYVGLGAAAFALLLPQRRTVSGGVVAAGLLAVNEWALKPVMAMARTDGAALHSSFGAWHGVAGAIYLGACAAVAVVVLKGVADVHD
jgi:hypothetical protein